MALAARRNPHSPGDGLLRRPPLAALACLGIDGSWTLGVGCGLSRCPATAGWAPWRPGLGGVSRPERTVAAGSRGPATPALCVWDTTLSCPEPRARPPAPGTAGASEAAGASAIARLRPAAADRVPAVRSRVDMQTSPRRSLEFYEMPPRSQQLATSPPPRLLESAANPASQSHARRVPQRRMAVRRPSLAPSGEVRSRASLGVLTKELEVSPSARCGCQKQSLPVMLGASRSRHMVKRRPKIEWPVPFGCVRVWGQRVEGGNLCARLANAKTGKRITFSCID